jgi:hypothetical protein
MSAIEFGKIECEFVADPQGARLVIPRRFSPSATAHFEREGFRPHEISRGSLSHRFQYCMQPLSKGLRRKKPFKINTDAADLYAAVPIIYVGIAILYVRFIGRS